MEGFRNFLFVTGGRGGLDLVDVAVDVEFRRGVVGGSAEGDGPFFEEVRTPDAAPLLSALCSVS